MSAIDTLIFDLDGTLVHTFPDVAAAVNAGRAQMDCPPLSDAEIECAIGPGKQAFLDALMPGTSPAEQSTFLDHFRDHYTAHCLDETRLYDGIEAVLDSAQGCRLAVATNKPRATSTKILDGLGVLHRFDLLLGPDDVAQAKPHPEMIQKILSRFSVSPDSVVMIGDTANDMLAGRAAGTATAAALWGYGHREELKTHQPDFPLEAPADIHHIFSHKLCR